MNKEQARSLILAHMSLFGSSEKEAKDALRDFCRSALEAKTYKWLSDSLSDLSIENLRIFPTLIEEQDDTQAPRKRGRPAKGS